MEPKESSRRPQEVRVHFDESPSEVCVEYPASENANAWYSRVEVSNMANTQRSEVLRLSLFLLTTPAASIRNEHLIEMLGLQNYVSPIVAQGVIRNRNSHRAAVLNEQNRDTSTPDTLRLASVTHSGLTSVISHQLALRFFNMS